MLFHWIEEQARRNPGKAALIHNGMVVDYSRLRDAIRMIRQNVAGQGAASEGWAILLIENHLLAWCWLIALRSLGFTTIVLSDIKSIADMKVGGARYVVTDRPASAAATIRASVELSTKVLDARLPTGRFAGPIPDRSDRGGHVLLSSGTTGTPKKVLITASGDDADRIQHQHVMPKSSDTVYNVGSFQLSTSAGYRAAARTWAAGGTVLSHQSSDIWAPFVHARVTDVDLTPISLRRLLESLPPELARNDALRLHVLGGAAPWSVIMGARERLTDHLYAVLGATETGVMAKTRLDAIADLTRHQPVAGRRVSITDDAGNSMGIEEEGRLASTPSPGVAGYLGDDETSEAFFQFGMFYTGDLAKWAQDGALELVGRSSNVMNLLGRKLSPEPIEARLQERFSISAVCVFSAPSVRGGEAIHVVIEGVTPPLEAQARAIEAALHGWPEVVIHSVRDLPRNLMGKLLRAEVRKLVLESAVGGLES